MSPTRQSWMSILAKALPREIEAAWLKLDEPPTYRLLRPPETGMVMARGRAGGTGDRFNLGEMTVTRAAVRLADGATGHAYVAGRHHRHAELAAVFDALLQKPELTADIDARVIQPLADAQAARKRQASEAAAATKVDFFTVVRGED